MNDEQISERLRKRFSSLRIGILGFGMEGRSTLAFLRNLLPDVVFEVADRDAAHLSELVEAEKAGRVVLHAGDDYAEALSSCDLVFKTPGIPWKEIDHCFRPEQITSQVDLFLSVLGDRTLGITGTKGKSTTTAILTEALKACGRNAVMVGNIGIPALDLVLSDAPDRVYVLECSSHMLETIRHAPRGALYLNLYEDHLDHYRSFEGYAGAKENLLRLQGPDDFAVIGDQVAERVRGLGNGRHFHVRVDPDGTLELPDNAFESAGTSGPVRIPESAFAGRRLRGTHNLLYMKTVLLAAWLFESLQGRDFDVWKAIDALNAFPGLPHRLEFISEVEGISFFDDSISTIPQASIAAVKSLGDVDTLVFGGMDRGIDYGPLDAYIAAGAIPNLVALPATGHAILTRLESEGRRPEGVVFFRAADMEEAVDAAFRLTHPGHSCVLSPAAASYGFYRNFEERGAHFARLVREHPSKIVLP